MKINKLFHWLYGALMCLPLLGVLFTSLYVTFNPNAKDSYYGETINEESYVLVDTFVVNNLYYVDFNNNSSATNDYNTLIYCSNVEILSSNFDITDTELETIRNAGYFRLWFNPTYNQNFLTFENYGSNFPSLNKFINFSFTYLGNNNDSLNISNYFANQVYEKEYNKYSYLDNSVSYAINDINNNPLYNWAQDSFLVAPIAFVTGLFGLTQTSPVVTLLSYWLTISIVWLVFDLIMYIPLLVHRWLDKGVLS